MTAHGSKGLEFEYVFLAGLQCFLLGKETKTGRWLYFTRYHVYLLNRNITMMKNCDDYFMWRLHGQNNILIFLISRFKNDGKELEPSMFIAEIQDQHQHIDTEQSSYRDEAVI